MMRCRIGAFAFVIALWAGSSSTTVAGNNLPSSTAKHQAVTEGSFDIRLGQSIDLTDRKVLLAFFVGSSNDHRSIAEKSAWFKIAGREYRMSQGTKLDLKYQLKDVFKDLSHCYLELLDVVAPKGASPIAQLRLICQ